MKKERRRLILCFLIIAASLFLFSCGIPTIISLKSINITRNQLSDTSVEIIVSGNEPDLDLVSSRCPGLLLCYIVTENQEQGIMIKDDVVDAFSKNFTNKIVISNIDSSMFKVDDYTLYAFKPDQSEYSHVGSPTYNHNLHKYISGHNINAELTLTHYENQAYDLSDGESLYNRIYTSDVKGQKYIHIFAAFTAEEGMFTNVYLSDLSYIGYIIVNNPQ